MFDTIIALFERLVIAHEKLAASQEALLQNCNCVAPVEEPAAEPEPQKEKKTRGKKKEEAPAPEPETPAPAEEPATPEVVEAPVSHEEMKAAVKTYAVRHGKDKAKALIVEVGKAEKLADITDQALINALYAAATEA